MSLPYARIVYCDEHKNELPIGDFCPTCVANTLAKLKGNNIKLKAALLYYATESNDVVYFEGGKRARNTLREVDDEH